MPSKLSKKISSHVISKLRESDRKLGLAKAAYVENYVSPEDEQALYDVNKKQLGRAGGVLGGATSGLGGALLGAAAGARRAAKGSKLHHGGKWGLIGLGAGTLAGGLGGRAIGRSEANAATQQDIGGINEAVEDEITRQQVADEDIYGENLPPYDEEELGKYSASPDNQESLKPPPPRNTFIAPHITGDASHALLVAEKSLRTTPDVPPTDASFEYGALAKTSAARAYHNYTVKLSGVDRFAGMTGKMFLNQPKVPFLQRLRGVKPPAPTGVMASLPPRYKQPLGTRMWNGAVDAAQMFLP